MTANRLHPPPALPPLPESWLPREHPLHRPRHGTRQTTAKVSALAFFCVPLLLLGLGVRAPEFENHKLADFPSIGDGWGFLTGLDRWGTDQLPLRDSAVSAADGISRGVFGEAPPFARGEAPKKPDVGPVVAPVEPNTPIPAPPPPAKYQEVVEGSDGWLYWGYDIEGACEPKRPLDEVFTQLNTLRAAVESSGRKFVLLVAPNKSTMVPEHLPPGYFGADCAAKTRDEFWRRVSAETRAVDLRPVLDIASKRLKAPVYSKLDTHWTYDGGLVFSRTMAEQVKPGSTTSWRSTPGKIIKIPGDLSSLLGQGKSVVLQSYEIAPDGKTVRSPNVDGSFAEPRRITQKSGAGMIDSKVGMLGDSFTMYVRQYVVPGYTDITIQNSDFIPRDPGKTAAMLADKDVVVLEAAERSLVSGTNPMLDANIIATVAAELAKKPR